MKDTLYTVVDRLTAGRGVPRIVCGERVRFPARWCRYYPREYEPETFRFLRACCRSGDVALDIGAHIGLFSVLLARLVGPTGRVFSFEPTPLTNQVLGATVRLNGVEDVVEVRPEAIARASAVAGFYVSAQAGSNANSLAAPAADCACIPVSTLSIDDFAAARGVRINCLKIDAEGAERDVLLGAERTFLGDRPYATLALHPLAMAAGDAALPEIWSILESFRMAVQYHGAPVSRDWFCGNTDLFDVQLVPVC